MKNILVVGGAGYIGAHMVKLLGKSGFNPVTLDNLCSGTPNNITHGTFIEGNMEDADLVARIIREHQVEAVMHFAAHIRVEESTRDPAKYYRNNTANTLALLDTLVKNGVKYFIFSSTAAVFGAPDYLPIDEAHPRQPVNPYGLSKYLVEQALPDFARAYGLKFGCLRYFNAAGADEEGEIGQLHEPRTHIIPIMLDVANGKRDHVAVYGTDYATKDGSCVRDYIHIQDLCSAHLLLLDYLRQGGQEQHFNLGTENGYTVLEVLECARRITGKPIKAEIAGRRAGDPPALVADSKKARTILGWNPVRSDLETIIADAWRWEQRPK